VSSTFDQPSSQEAILAASPITNLDTELVQRSIRLARQGVGLVSPNPLVGCVILSADGRVVGEGSYTYEGVTHAEVLALQQAGPAARGGTAYVSLEPHSHRNRTAPCTEALIEAGIKRVVAPIEDPNPLVSGRGFQRLREAGVEVVTGILADEATRLNEKFICWHRKGRPFVHLKLAMSFDGRISLNRSVSTALSGEAAKVRVQELRHEHDAILVGSNTAFVDNPNLTDRSGKPRRRPLVRVILDNRLRLDPESNLVKTARETPTVVITESQDGQRIQGLQQQGVDVVETDRGGRDLGRVLKVLADREIQSVLVEGGSEIAGAFCDTRLVDKVTFIAAPLIIGGPDAPIAIGGKGAANISEALRLRDISVEPLGDDLEITGYPTAS
jgi:diaminohydroxyphosphoribosylaminopyrimidine deaminase/5-amino-6-(5-phosphoribosylamino)uracil reductase